MMRDDSNKCFFFKQEDANEDHRFNYRNKCIFIKDLNRS